MLLWNMRRGAYCYGIGEGAHVVMKQEKRRLLLYSKGMGACCCRIREGSHAVMK